MSSRKKKSYEIWGYLFIAGIAFMAVLIASVNLFHYCYKMNADIASEAVLAQLIWESGEWIPSSWYPSTELRILGTPNLASLFYGITRNMILAMGIACTVMTAGILLSGYFFISQFSFDRLQKLAFLLLCLILPNHFITLELVYLMAGYYAIHVIILFFTMGVYARMINGKKVNILCWSSIVFLSFVMGMQGMRGILILGGPLMVTEVIRQFYSVCVRKWKKKSLMICGWCLLVLLAGYTGTCMPLSVGQESISKNIRRGLRKLWETVIPDVLACLGWTETSILGKAIILILLSSGVLGLVYSVKQIFTRSQISNDTWIYLLLLCSPIITMLLAAFTTVESSERYYFILLYALAFGWVCLLQRMAGCSEILRGGGYAVILLLLILQVTSVYLPIMKSEEPSRNEAYETGRYLVENQYAVAYAGFENANTITVLTNGTVRIAAVSTMEKMDVCKWLSSSDWYVPNVPYECLTAYIVTETEKESFQKFYDLHHEDIQFDMQIGKFLIYVSDYNFSSLE